MWLIAVGGLSLKADIISKLNMKLIVVKIFICLKIKKINFKIICNYTIFENKFLCFFQTLGNKMRYLPKVTFFSRRQPKCQNNDWATYQEVLYQEPRFTQIYNQGRSIELKEEMKENLWVIFMERKSYFTWVFPRGILVFQFN